MRLENERKRNKRASATRVTRIAEIAVDNRKLQIIDKAVVVNEYGGTIREL